MTRDQITAKLAIATAYVKTGAAGCATALLREALADIEAWRAQREGEIEGMFERKEK